MPAKTNHCLWLHRTMRQYPERRSALALWSRRLALFGLAVVLAGPILARTGALPPLQGLVVIGAGLVCSGLGFVLSVLAYVEIWRSGATGLMAANVACLVSMLTLAWPATQVVTAFRLPAINDISTDLADPPTFARSRNALDARRGYVPHEMPVTIRGSQRDAYPDIGPILLEMMPEEAYETVLEAIGEMKWRVIDQVPPSARTGSGRIDAITRTPVLGFTDDITIRLRALPNETRVDIRSTSRLGKHDLGTNAARIRRFTQALRALDRN
ncbi:MAG: DUF1499 domain-containing protein [Proteobacteria bacterium]|nr:DUF1499 domain-containing protein [Pseudomonadota bacterium]